jgi:hypothetical protein
VGVNVNDAKSADYGLAEGSTQRDRDRVITA